jgi:hypothetical protein
MFALTILYTSKNALLMFGDDAQSGMKRDLMRVTFVEVERLLLCFPSCDSKRWGHKLQTGEPFSSGVTVT